MYLWKISCEAAAESLNTLIVDMHARMILPLISFSGAESHSAQRLEYESHEFPAKVLIYLGFFKGLYTLCT